MNALASGSTSAEGNDEGGGDCGPPSTSWRTTTPPPTARTGRPREIHAERSRWTLASTAACRSEAPATSASAEAT